MVNVFDMKLSEGGELVEFVNMKDILWDGDVTPK